MLALDQKDVDMMLTGIHTDAQHILDDRSYRGCALHDEKGKLRATLKELIEAIEIDERTKK